MLIRSIFINSINIDLVKTPSIALIDNKKIVTNHSIYYVHHKENLGG